jgi:hypothetical protein
MKEFAPSVGEFATWKGDEARRERFLKRLIKIIVRTATCSFAAGIPIAEWKQCDELYSLRQCKFQPYPLCGWACAEQVYRWCDTTRVDRSHVSFVFEHGDRYQGHLGFLVKRDFGTAIHTEEKKKLGALQAADFAAWHVRNVLQKHHDNQLDGFRKDFEALFSRVQYEPYHRHFSMVAARTTDGGPRRVSSLVRFCEEHLIPKR